MPLLGKVASHYSNNASPPVCRTCVFCLSFMASFVFVIRGGALVAANSDPNSEGHPPKFTLPSVKPRCGERGAHTAETTTSNKRVENDFLLLESH